ncbi:putative G-protein coupled receptor 83-like isoform X2 [Dinothrombium tinctorium]|uniref:Putative G-protein coupled receptor 83-like isoform X2 n=1 Tax=Dinothrombium tinctorium TaxID=1965070 RepID=A0A3S3P0Q6_9ACAR|nr:putative G-protein coupled receptor 83-like isoform X2 [Dinothrombium tinctorium]RWS08582.1 putative G-protein coupled receptor 83-like isoform X2 [Dinothrombium tinctorium]
MNLTNETNATAASAKNYATNDYYVRDLIILTLYSITSILALFGNYLVCKIIFAKNSKLRNSTYTLVGNLAFSDILCGLTIPGQWIFCSTHALDVWKLEFFCAVTKSVQVLSFYISSLMMMLIAIERYHGIMYPLRPKLKTKPLIVIAWTLTIIFVATSIGSAKIFEYFTNDRIISCRIVLKFKRPFDSDNLRMQRVWGIWLGQYFLPLFVTAILYALVVRRIWHRERIGIATITRSENESEKKRIIFMLITVVVVFTLCWLPLHALNFTDYMIKQLEKKSGGRGGGKLCNDSTLYFLLYWLGISSCCYNPFIYWWMNPAFRRGYLRLFPSFISRYFSRKNNRAFNESAEPCRQLTKSTKSSKSSSVELYEVQGETNQAFVQNI